MKTVNLTDGPDEYTLGAREDTVINALAGNDNITLYGEFPGDPGLGKNVNVTVNAGAGDDTVTANYHSNFSIFGDDGNDYLTVNEGEANGGAGNDTLLSSGEAMLSGGTGNDSVTTEGWAYGDEGDDMVSGGFFASGGAGNDYVTTSYGAGSETLLYGDAGSDHVVGGAGDDFISGGAGKDYLTGGAGADVFQFGHLDSRTGGGARDVITDFQRGVDKIDLSALGITSFSELTFKSVGSGVIVYADLDHNGLDGADFGLQLTGIKVMAADDFIFA